MINMVGNKILKDDDIVSIVIKYIDEDLYNYEDIFYSLGLGEYYFNEALDL